MMGKPPDGDSEPLLGEADASGYRRPLPGFSTNAPALSANRRAAQGFWEGPALTGAMDRSLSEGETRTWSSSLRAPPERVTKRRRMRLRRRRSGFTTRPKSQLDPRLEPSPSA